VNQCPLAAHARNHIRMRNVKLSFGGSIHDPTDLVGRLLFEALALVAEFESDLVRMRA
jgi:DNA invertase Pin-like site-specific DNA recombinase